MVIDIKKKIFMMLIIIHFLWKRLILCMNLIKIIKTNFSIIQKNIPRHFMKLIFKTKNKMITTGKISQFVINQDNLMGSKEINFTKMSFFILNNLWDNQIKILSIDIYNIIVTLSKDFLRISDIKNLIKITSKSIVELKRCYVIILKAMKMKIIIEALI